MFHYWWCVLAWISLGMYWWRCTELLYTSLFMDFSNYNLFLLSFEDSDDIDVRSFLLAVQICEALFCFVFIYFFCYSDWIISFCNCTFFLPFPFSSLYILFFFTVAFYYFIYFKHICNCSWRIFMFAALKALSDNSNILHLGVGIYWLSFFVQVLVFLLFTFPSYYNFRISI